MLKRECGNPLATELKKGDGKRHIACGDFKKVVKDGLKFCAYCGANRVRGNRKYCDDICRDHVYAFCYPQKEWGLEYHLQRQEYKCVGCEFDYIPALEKICEKYEERNIHTYKSNKTCSVGIFSYLKQVTDKLKRPEVDHIVAIALGGDPVGFDNHQVLCYECHKSKTKIDVSEIAKARKQ